MDANGRSPRALTMARAAPSRSPRTYRSPSLTAPASIPQGQSERVTSIGRKRSPWRSASLTSVAGW